MQHSATPTTLLMASLCSHMHPTSMAGWQGVACIVVVYQPLTIAFFTAPKNMGTRLLSETARKLTSYFSKALSQNHDHQKTSLATPSNVCYISLQCATSYFCTQNHCHRTITTRQPPSNLWYVTTWCAQ